MVVSKDEALQEPFRPLPFMAFYIHGYQIPDIRPVPCLAFPILNERVPILYFLGSAGVWKTGGFWGQGFWGQVKM